MVTCLKFVSRGNLQAAVLAVSQLGAQLGATNPLCVASCSAAQQALQRCPRLCHSRFYRWLPSRLATREDDWAAGPPRLLEKLAAPHRWSSFGLRRRPGWLRSYSARGGRAPQPAAYSGAQRCTQPSAEKRERELENSEKKRPRARRRHPTDGPTRRGFGVIFAEQPAALAAR